MLRYVAEIRILCYKNSTELRGRCPNPCATLHTRTAILHCLPNCHIIRLIAFSFKAHLLQLCCFHKESFLGDRRSRARFRFKAMEENIVFVCEINQRTRGDWVINETTEENQRIMQRYRHTNQEESKLCDEMEGLTALLPTPVSWRTENLGFPIKNDP